jgi:hypothetical protein
MVDMQPMSILDMQLATAEYDVRFVAHAVARYLGRGYGSAVAREGAATSKWGLNEGARVVQ